MKITDMTKPELLAFMKGNGEIHRYNIDSYAWKHAFKLAKLSGMEHLEMDCSKCVDKVKEWILK
jgi:hypothetical protein